MDKYERCVMAIKAKGQGYYNPWAICTKTVGRMGGKVTREKRKLKGRERRIYEGPRGGKFYIEGKRKIYVS